MLSNAVLQLFKFGAQTSLHDFLTCSSKMRERDENVDFRLIFLVTIMNLTTYQMLNTHLKKEINGSPK